MSRALVSFMLCALSALVWAQDEDRHYTQSDFGGVGLLQMPSARMNPEGEFSFFISNVYPYTRAGVAVQPYPWVEALFRYTSVSNRLYGPDIAGDQDYKDKSFDVKFQLLEESYYLPQIAVGFRDVGGTGLYSGEYIAASKQYGDFDFTLGMGWGYLGSRGGVNNPLAYLSDRFEGRGARTGQGGEFSVGNYFSGEGAAIFAGVEYYAKWAPLIFKAEFDGNDYQNEPLDNNQSSSIPVNLGVVYRLNEEFDVSVAWERGEELMLGITLHTNFGQGKEQPKLLDPEPVKLMRNINSKPRGLSPESLIRELHLNAGFRADELYLSERELIVVGEQERYRKSAKGLGRASRILANEVPVDVDWFTFVGTEKGEALDQLTINRSEFENLLKNEGASLGDVWLSTEQVAPAPLSEAPIYKREPDAFRYWFGPGFTQSIGGPDGFILYEVSAQASSEYYFSPNTWLSGGIGAAVISNFDKFKYTAPSKLPRVRTNIKEYLTTSDVRMGNLQLNHFEKLEEDWFALGYAGYLEGMFGGVGAELLYSPYGEDWAVGADLNFVRQRDFDMAFGYRDYSVLTGHGTLYYQLPWLPGTLIQASVGRYLAKDLGVTFDLSRSFDNGVNFGVWATFTDVSSEQFGEGSFDKGFYITLPLDLFFVQSTKRITRLNWSFLTRDGGQKLSKRYHLYKMVQRGDHEALKRNFTSLLD